MLATAAAAAVHARTPAASDGANRSASNRTTATNTGGTITTDNRK